MPSFLAREIAENQSSFTDADLREAAFRFLKMIDFATAAPALLHFMRYHVERPSGVTGRQKLPYLRVVLKKFVIVRYSKSSPFHASARHGPADSRGQRTNFSEPNHVESPLNARNSEIGDVS
jgi:hypothetical protein